MSLNVSPVSPLLCLLAATALQWASPAARADDDDRNYFYQPYNCSGPVTRREIIPFTSPRHLESDGAYDSYGPIEQVPLRSVSTQVTVARGQNLFASAVRAGENPGHPLSPVIGWIAVIGPDGRMLSCHPSDNSGRLSMSLQKLSAPGVYQVQMMTMDMQNKYAVSASASGDAGIVDCGVHRTAPVTNADGSVTYPGEHAFMGSLPLQKGDNLGVLTSQNTNGLDDPDAPVNGWAYIYRPDGRLLTCVRNDSYGQLDLSIKGVPDTGIYHLRLVTPENFRYGVRLDKWTDLAATLTSGASYAFPPLVYPQQAATFTVNVPKAGAQLVVAFDDKNPTRLHPSNALAVLTSPTFKTGIFDMATTGFRTPPLELAGNYTVKVMPKPGTRLTGAITVIVN